MSPLCATGWGDGSRDWVLNANSRLAVPADTPQLSGLAGLASGDRPGGVGRSPLRRALLLPSSLGLFAIYKFRQ